MKLKEFNHRIKQARTKGPQIDALKRVLVDGETAYQVWKDTGVDQAQLLRLRRKIERDMCKTCKQFIKETAK